MYDVAIAGGGPGGAALAAGLAREGWGVLLLERATQPVSKVCGEFLSPEALSSLAELGVREELSRLGPASIGTARIAGAAGRSVPVRWPTAAWGLSRSVLDPALRNAAARAGAELRLGATALGAERDGAGWLLRVRSGAREESVRARVVVEAAGRGRALAAPPGFSRGALPSERAGTGRGSDSERGAVGLKCHLEGLAHPEVLLCLFPGGYAGLAPVEGGRVNFAALLAPAVLRAMGGGLPGLLHWLQHRHLGFRAALGGGDGVRICPGSTAAVSGVRTDLEPAPWSRLARVGDAAVMLPPFCGDGQALALRNARLLAPLIGARLQGRLTEAALQWRYQAAWFDTFGPMVRTARRLERWLTHPVAAEVLLWAGARIPGLTARLFAATRSAPTPGPGAGTALGGGATP